MLGAAIHELAPTVRRRILRVLGPVQPTELADLTQEVFVQALGCVDRLRDVRALPAWLGTVATRTSLRWLRARRAERWLLGGSLAGVAEPRAEPVSPEVRQACRRVRQLLDRLPARERALLLGRHVEQRELRELAEAEGVSLATLKRRLRRVERRFARAAARDEVLRPWVEDGGRWQAAARPRQSTVPPAHRPIV